MTQEVVIIIAEDDDGHARLIENSLRRVGLHNAIHRCGNGQEALDFLFRRGPGPHRTSDTPYLLMLDIRMPKVDGVETLRQIKEDPSLRKLPVIMLTTTDDPREIERCHLLGCNNYIVKPVDFGKFAEAIAQLGMFVSLVQVPEINDAPLISSCQSPKRQ
ncbi:MAG: response regulator [Verrucomicrobia bacterium]|nr:response regulator [Verrucomicrobiota bacterium]